MKISFLKDEKREREKRIRKENQKRMIIKKATLNSMVKEMICKKEKSPSYRKESVWQQQRWYLNV